jgi:hypothetical protein
MRDGGRSGAAKDKVDADGKEAMAGEEARTSWRHVHRTSTHTREQKHQHLRFIRAASPKPYLSVNLHSRVMDPDRSTCVFGRGVPKPP